MRRLGTALLAIGLVACDSASEPSGSDVHVVSEAPSQGTPLAHETVTTEAPAKVLGVLKGAIAAGTDSGLLAAGTPGATSLTRVEVLSDSGGATSGGVQAIVQRANGSLLFTAAEGLFVELETGVALSPLSQSLPKTPFTSVASFGSGDTEELWFTSTQGMIHVSGGKVTSLTLAGVTNPSIVVATRVGEAVVFADGSLWQITGGADNATQLASNLGSAWGGARDANGTAWFATESGLVAFTVTGDVSRHTLAAAGAAPQRVCGVFADGSSLYVGTSTALLRLGRESFEQIGELEAATGACPLAVDSLANVYVADIRGLTRFGAGTSTGVSFDAQIKPILNATCMVCHENGASYAPKLQLTDYSTAKALASTIVTRIQDTTSPMPPTGSGMLSASDVQLIVRWSQEGLAP